MQTTTAKKPSEALLIAIAAGGDEFSEFTSGIAEHFRNFSFDCPVENPYGAVLNAHSDIVSGDAARREEGIKTLSEIVSYLDQSGATIVD